jgi:hypothetical protein
MENILNILILGVIAISLEDKKTFLLVLRYNIFVEIENDSHIQTHNS